MPFFLILQKYFHESRGLPLEMQHTSSDPSLLPFSPYWHACHSIGWHQPTVNKQTLYYIILGVSCAFHGIKTHWTLFFKFIVQVKQSRVWLMIFPLPSHLFQTMKIFNIFFLFNQTIFCRNMFTYKKLCLHQNQAGKIFIVIYCVAWDQFRENGHFKTWYFEFMVQKFNH